MFVKGHGSYLWDTENRKYLDFTAGIAVTALGHCDPGIEQIMHDQARTLVHCSNLYHNPWMGTFSKLIIEKTRAAGAMQSAARVFVCNSGSEANEAALKFARKVGKAKDPSGQKFEILSFQNSFHGRTFGSLSATPNPKYQKPFSPMIPGFRYAPYNEVSGLESVITDRTCGVIVEPIQGEGGVHLGTELFMLALRKRCNETGAVLIYDEIQSGLGRSGKLWAHAHLPKSAHPDILTTAKALGNGFPVGATIVSEDVASRIDVGDHGTTFGGNPMACRIAHYMVTRLSDPALLQSVREKSEICRTLMEHLTEEFPEVILGTRGRGLILGLQLSQDPAALLTAAREMGLLIITCGVNTIRLVPALNVTESELRSGFQLLRRAFTRAYRRSSALPTTQMGAMDSTRGSDMKTSVTT